MDANAAIQIYLNMISVLLMSVAAGILFKSGLVHTGIVAQMIFTTLTLAYLSEYGLSLGLLAALITSTVVIILSFLARFYNRRTYIIVLYSVSLGSVAAGNLVLRLAAGPDDLGSKSPAIDLSFSSHEATVFVGAAAAVAALTLLLHFQKSWRSVLLEHWGSLPARSVKDMHVSGVFNFGRLAQAAWLPGLAAAAMFVAAAIFGLARAGAYSSGDYDIPPFIALLFAIASRDRPWLLLIMVILYGAARAAIGIIASTLGGSFPIPGLHLVYGLMFVFFFAYAAREQK